MHRTPTSFSETTAAAVRTHFALTQAELGRWLGVSLDQVRTVEAGRRNFSPKAAARLARLAELLPPLGPALPAPDTLPPPPPRVAQAAKETREAELLRRRVRRCEHLAYQLGFQLETLALQDAALLRRRQGLAALRQGLATPPAGPAPGYDAVGEEAWLARIEADTAALPSRPGPLARAHLALRRQLLLEEAAALRHLLGPAPEL
ncbi:Helix-turn-helix domain-containing protein [Hymenobacter daecheongensis DSM 21074]|uniref:Helix-turn-helix domain-containing protein n=1 Tax=Hymenobacter daecheongensis DSM 21074 TaxID=1121955 RepID=A0A1M6J7X9_9BACT|nr:helix-turn-helix domain-containing protein [Hymenobacter daecheongensis]SHJ42772.1 Helix-turn-helix domain-containing protein [Hymenobacter daecheongensis DSM 21074]